MVCTFKLLSSFSAWLVDSNGFGVAAYVDAVLDDGVNMCQRFSRWGKWPVITIKIRMAQRIGCGCMEIGNNAYLWLPHGSVLNPFSDTVRRYGCEGLSSKSMARDIWLTKLNYCVARGEDAKLKFMAIWKKPSLHSIPLA